MSFPILVGILKYLQGFLALPHQTGTNPTASAFLHSSAMVAPEHRCAEPLVVPDVFLGWFPSVSCS